MDLALDLSASHGDDLILLPDRTVGRMKTRVMVLPNERQVWEGELPIVPIGHRINHEGTVYRVIGSGLALSGSYPADMDHGVRQTLVVEEQQ